MRTLRTAIAIVAAPLGCAALLAIAYHYTVSKDPTPDNVFNVWFFFALILLSVSLTAGVAIHISLYCLRRRTLPPYVAVGGLGGGLVAALFADMIHDTAFWMSPLDLPLWSTIVFLGVVAATLTSGMFWLMRRPDRDDAPSSRPKARSTVGPGSKRIVGLRVCPWVPDRTYGASGMTKEENAANDA